MSKKAMHVCKMTIQTLDYGDVLRERKGSCLTDADGHPLAAARGGYRFFEGRSIDEMRTILGWFDVIETKPLTIKNDINPRGDV